MLITKPVEKVIDIVSEILAMVVITFILLLYINTKVSFLPEDALATMTYIREIGIVLVLGAKASEFALKRGLILFIICAAIIIAAFVLILIPGTVWTAPAVTEALLRI